jgi:hypothetical protein
MPPAALARGEIHETHDKKKPAYVGGLNPYQRRHGGDKANTSKTFGATQHQN